MIPNDQTGEFGRHKELTFSIEKFPRGNDTFEKYISEWENIVSSTSIPTAFALIPVLAYVSKNGGYFDIKTKYSESTGGKFSPVLLSDNIITTGRR